jgi:hypothetical protein
LPQDIVDVAAKRSPAREGLVKHDSYGVPVACRCNLATNRLLWGHVRGSSRDGDAVATIPRIELRHEAKIENDNSSFIRNQNIGWFDIPMQFASFMERVQPLSQLPQGRSQAIVVRRYEKLWVMGQRR